jgi:hypothetical protein
MGPLPAALGILVIRVAPCTGRSIAHDQICGEANGPRSAWSHRHWTKWTGAGALA